MATLKYDQELVAIAQYASSKSFIPTAEALAMVHHCLFDSLACAALATKVSECMAVISPISSEINVTNGSRVFATPFILDPVQSAFAIGTLIRWLDFNDTWLAAEWGHPSDNFGAILAVSDYVSRVALSAGKAPYIMADILLRAVKAYEIQGVLALNNSFNEVGIDHVILVKLASVAIATELFGGSKQDIEQALSHVWLDGNSLRTYRHYPNTGPRKSWAAGDATSRAVRLAYLILQGKQQGYPRVLSTPKWGFNDVILRGKPITISREFGSYVAENILLKIAFPAEFHSQTAIECAIELYPFVASKIDQIERIEIYTQEPGKRIISKTGELRNPADRDHCIQYIVAIALLKGNLTELDYTDEVAADPRIDFLRSRMIVDENEQFTEGYYDPTRRSIANSVQVFFTDGTATEKVIVEYPIGHKRRRSEGHPYLREKILAALKSVYSPLRAEKLIFWWENPEEFQRVSVTEFLRVAHKPHCS
jgi:2-methylcitrate dehydratase